MRRLLVDTHVLSGEARSLPLSWLADFEFLPFAPRALRGNLDADALLVRTTTRVDAHALAGLPNLRALATLSSGTDHLDLAAISERQVSLHTGHGGNALAVADWVLWALTRLPLQHRRVLIVGVGAVGTAVAELLAANGLDVTLCDPPRAEREPNFTPLTLDEALGQGPWGAVTLHVPKVTAGPHATANLLDGPRLKRLQGAVVLNAARGGVVEEATAVALRRSGHLAGLAVDTFVGEPAPLPELLRVADLVTPHIAGHSVEGKLRVAHRAVTGLRSALGMRPPGALETAIAGQCAELHHVDLSPFAALDAAASALQKAPLQFEAIRHAHRRLEQFLR